MPCQSIILIPNQPSLLALLDAEDPLIRHYTFHEVGKGLSMLKKICMKIYLTSTDGFCRNSEVWPKRVASLSWRSNSEAVELLRCGHGLTCGAVHLPLADHVQGLDAGDDNAGTPQ